MTKNVYTRDDIEMLFNEKVAEMVAEGRVLNLRSMNSVYSDELGHVDFKDGDKVLRVWLVRDEEDDIKTLDVMVRRYEYRGFGGLWTYEGEELYTARFYVLNKHWYGVDDEDVLYTMDKEKAQRAREMRRERAKARAGFNVQIMNKERVARLVRRHKGYGRVKAEDVRRVTKSYSADGGIWYRIDFNNDKRSLKIG